MKTLLALACAVPLFCQDAAVRTPPPDTKAAAAADAKPAADMKTADQNPPAAAQPPATDSKPAADAQTPPAEAKPEDAKPAAAAGAQSPVPSAESWLTGWIDLGYRWRSGVAGSFDTYRSIVNLGSGPKLFGSDFSITDPRHRFFDRIDVRAYSWGDEPYEVFHLDARKAKLYDFNADYRDLAYFNFLPSYADPLLSRGVILNQQSFDTRRRFASFSLDLLPGNWFVPYFAFDRDSGSGTGVNTFVTDANDFPVPTALRDLTNLYRGGVHFNLRRFHVTLEQGGTTFRDDQNLVQPAGVTNFGDVSAPVFGQKTDLTGLIAAYGVRGDSVYSKALFTANAANWLDLYGQFLFSQPDTNVNYQQAAAGNLLLQSQLLFYTSQQFLLASAARLPHTSASFGAEIRPLKRVRIVESWLTDRLHNTSSASSNQILVASGISQQITALLSSSLENNYNQQEIQIYFDATRKLILRGGYRYVWGNAADATLPPEGLVSADTAKLHRQVALGGFTWRPLPKISLTGESEVASSSGAYFRTSLYDYQKVRAQARYQAFGSLSFAFDFTYLNNQNPVPGVNYNYQARQESLSFLYAPKAGKRWNIQGSYSRSAVFSQVAYLDPTFLNTLQSIYRDNAHTATGLFTFNPSHLNGLQITAGGSLLISAGSRPTTYFQPYAKALFPLNKHVAWFGQWTYYGYGESFYLFEGFRAHLLTTGLRFSR